MKLDMKLVVAKSVASNELLPIARATGSTFLLTPHDNQWTNTFTYGRSHALAHRGGKTSCISKQNCSNHSFEYSTDRNVAGQHVGLSKQSGATCWWWPRFDLELVPWRNTCERMKVCRLGNWARKLRVDAQTRCQNWNVKTRKQYDCKNA
jgi:hypothetical protein